MTTTIYAKLKPAQSSSPSLSFFDIGVCKLKAFLFLSIFLLVEVKQLQCSECNTRSDVGKIYTTIDESNFQIANTNTQQRTKHSRPHRLLQSVSTLLSPTVTTILRIDCGSNSTTEQIDDNMDSINGTEWTQDKYFSARSGQSVNACKNNTNANLIDTSSDSNSDHSLSTMYCTQRIGPLLSRIGPFRKNVSQITYYIPVQSGAEYFVTMHFMETYFKRKRQHMAQIRIGGKVVRKSLDYVAEFGYYTPGSLTFGPFVMQKNLMLIRLISLKNRPIISGIEISTTTEMNSSPTAFTTAPTTAPKVTTSIPTKAPTYFESFPIMAPSSTVPVVVVSPPIASNSPVMSGTTLRINCGNTSELTGSFFDTITSEAWTHDQYYSSGIAVNNCANPSSMPSNFTLFQTPRFLMYCSHRLGPTDVHAYINYSIPVETNRNYFVRMHFLEPFFRSTNKRVFSIQIEGKVVQSSLDVFSLFGYFGPGSLTFGPFTALKSIINVQLIPLVNRPVVSGIEIFPSTEQNLILPTPTMTPAITPVTTPVMVPTSSAPIESPVESIVTTTSQPSNPIVYASLPLKMNIGVNNSFMDSFGKTWTTEQYLVDPIGTSTIFSANADQLIYGTFDDLIYRNVRQGSSFGYEIPLPIGQYEVTLHMCELYYNQTGERTFNVQVENESIEMIDMLANNNRKFTKYTLQLIKVVDDGKLSIHLTSPQNVSIATGLPVLAGITVNLLGEHLAHAVSNGPYTAIDREDAGYVMVPVDASNSHTHGEDMSLTSVVWTEGNVVLGTNLTMEFNMSVGEHEVTLTIADSGGTTSSDQTTILVHSFDYPSITSVSPDIGLLGGGENITLTGSGFIFPPNEISVRFGDILLEGSSSVVYIVNHTTICVVAPASLTSKDVVITVITPRGESTENARYTYDNPRLPVMFNSGSLQTNLISKPTACAFGPDKKLYVGNTFGKLMRFSVDFTGPTPTSTLDVELTVVTQGYAILGIAFDPAETNVLEPMIYFSNCDFFHLEKSSSSGLAINGRISRMKVTRTSPTTFTFTDLVHVITGLPVSDHDHGFNSIVFGNEGELYMASGGNTNGGRPGSLSSSGLQKDNYLSGSIVVANVSHPNFNGAITYTAPDDGDMVDRTHIDVFGHGLRNPFGLMIHSNGKLYATDNGPNAPYGSMTTGCGPYDFIPGKTYPDKVLLVEKGKYYGYPNLKRAAVLQEPHQCVYRAPDTLSTDSNNYTAPIAIMPSALGSLFEYTADYFDGQLRGNLIVAKYGDEFWKVVLTSDGTEAVAAAKRGISLGIGDNNLAATQAPDGTIIAVRYKTGQMFYHKPYEPLTTALKIYSVFPVRGTSVGMYFVSIYGLNFDSSTTTTTITVGGSPCLSQIFVSSGQIDCQLAGGVPGLVDIIAENHNTGERVVLTQGFRYINGFRI